MSYLVKCLGLVQNSSESITSNVSWYVVFFPNLPCLAKKDISRYLKEYMRN